MWCVIKGALEECRFLPSSCTCRRVPPAVDTATEDSPAVRGDVRWMVWGETTLKRLAAAHVGVAPCALTRGRITRYPLWLLLLVAVAVCSRCTVLPVPCVCVRELLLLGVTAAGMMVPLTVDGWRCSLFYSFSSSLYFSQSQAKKENKR
ncbi:trans-sialidase [Trypanosoma cruzi]|nr:chitin binding-like protein [Trypanosoma cruzi cruzi]RNF00272.1 trans-sialidase [Trypanosoma cruzi]